MITAQDEVDPAFADLMVRLAGAYPAAKLTPELVMTYARALRAAGLTIKQVRTLFSKAVTEYRFFPSIAELMKLVRPDADDSALLAWAALGRAAAEIGSYASLEVEDGRVAAALLAVFGSWPAYCRQAEEGPALALKRQEFLAAFRAANRTRQRNAPRRLVGLCETQGSYPSGTLAGRVWAGLLTAGGNVVPKRDTGLKALKPAPPEEQS